MVNGLDGKHVWLGKQSYGPATPIPFDFEASLVFDGDAADDGIRASATSLLKLVADTIRSPDGKVRPLSSYW